MSGPLYNNIAGTVTASPTTGSFTPTAAYTGSVAWSQVPNGIYPYRADGAAGWEIGYTNWNGTTLTRGPVASSNSNAAVSFSSDVVVQLCENSDRIMPHVATVKWGLWTPLMAGTAMSNISLGAPTVSGSPAAVAIASTNMLTRIPRIQYSASLVANAVVGLMGASVTSAGQLYSTDSNDIGFEIVIYFGIGTIPVASRLMVGFTNTAGLSTVEPSTLNNAVFFGKDSTDTNWQMMFRGTSATTKVDVGFAPATGVPYEVVIYKKPGNSDIICMLFCKDGSQAPFVYRIAAGTANMPTNNANQLPVCQLALSSDTTTGAVLYFMNLTLRSMI